MITLEPRNFYESLRDIINQAAEDVHVHWLRHRASFPHPDDMLTHDVHDLGDLSLIVVKHMATAETVVDNAEFSAGCP